MAKNINMENDNRCFAHFKRECDCRGVDKKAHISFSGMASIGVPICSECGSDMVLVGVEIIEKHLGVKK